MILLVITLLSIIISLYMLYVNRSLWTDEACFSFSFTQRNLGNLTNGAFEWVQTAPIIYLYIVKIITLILGNTEKTLRLFSFIIYIGTLVMVYLNAKKVFKMKYSLMPVAFVSTMQIILRYSNEFKCYMFDAFLVLSLLYVYYLYKEDKIRWPFFIGICVLLIWSSNPVCFFIAGIMIYELCLAIKNKEFKKLKKIIIGGIVLVLSFGIYYFYWLRQTSTLSEMQNYWIDRNFPLIPKNIDDLKKMKKLTNDIFYVYGNLKLIVLLLCGISLIIGIYKKDKYKTIICLSIIIALMASYIYMFPIKPRIWLFIYPIIALLIFDVYTHICTSNKIGKYILCFFCFILIFNNNGILFYLNKNNNYLGGEEINASIEYLKENIKEDEKIYVYNTAIPGFQYKNNYNTTFENHEVILGYGVFLTDWKMKYDEIVNENKMYLVFQQYNDKNDGIMTRVSKNGYLELVNNFADTPLYYYVNNINDMKSKIEYKNIQYDICYDEDYEIDRYILTVEINNIGETILNHKYDDIYISSKQDEKIRGKMKKNVKK